jgi:lysophospholipase L1-like esterase
MEADYLRLTTSSELGARDPEARRKAMDFLLARMKDAAARAGAHLVIVYIPYLERDSTNPPSPALSASLRTVAGPQVTVVDLTSAVVRYYSDPNKPLLRFDHDRHPNAAGHALIADGLEPVLRRRLNQ